MQRRIALEEPDSQLATLLPQLRNERREDRDEGVGSFGRKDMHMRRLVIVTGLSGAGKSQAMKSFEDFGFACLDNVPPVLASAFVNLARDNDRDTVALAFDVRSGGTFGEATATLEQLLNDGLRPE